MIIPEASLLGLFVVAAVVLLLTPGPAVLYIVTRSVEQGRLAGLVSALGVHAGTLVHVAAAALGVSALALTELPRALERAGLGAAAHRRARELLGRIALVDVDRRILTTAATLEPSALRTLDAIHLATALTVREDLEIVVTYERRLRAAAERVQFDVVAPA